MDDVIFEDLKRNIRDLISIQKENGNWNYSEYMHGMLNGMILVESLVNSREPDYFDPPERGYLNEKQVKSQKAILGEDNDL